MTREEHADYVRWLKSLPRRKDHFRMPCPECSATRSNPKDPSFSVHITREGGWAKCFHCDFAIAWNEDEMWKREQKQQDRERQKQQKDASQHHNTAQHHDAASQHHNTSQHHDACFVFAFVPAGAVRLLRIVYVLSKGVPTPFVRFISEISYRVAGTTAHFKLSPSVIACH